MRWAQDLLNRIETEEREGTVLQLHHLSPELLADIKSRKETLEIFYERGLENLKAYLGSIA